MTHKWFCYDDHLVSEIDPSRVCTPDAYILFYRRRDIYDSPSSDSIIKTSPVPPMELISQDSDDRLTSEETTIVEEKPTWPLAKEKQIQYTLEPPMPLPRRFVTPIPVPSSINEGVAAPCPAPRMRKIPILEQDLDSSFSHLGINSTPLPLTRQIVAPQPFYTTTIIKPNQYVEPFHNSSSMIHRHPLPEQINPWNRYNHQRYSDDERETNVIYPTTATSH